MPTRRDLCLFSGAVLLLAQACGDMVGKVSLLRLREKSKQALGARFDFRAVHDVVLLGGSLPLAVMEKRIDRYIADFAAAGEAMTDLQ